MTHPVCEMMGQHKYVRDPVKSQYYPEGYVVEKCVRSGCDEMTLTLMYDSPAGRKLGSL